MSARQSWRIDPAWVGGLGFRVKEFKKPLGCGVYSDHIGDNGKENCYSLNKTSGRGVSGLGFKVSGPLYGIFGSIEGCFKRLFSRPIS